MELIFCETVFKVVDFREGHSSNSCFLYDKVAGRYRQEGRREK